MHVLPWVTAGGVERRRMQLAQQLDPDQFEQRVVCMYSKYDFADDIRAAGVDVVCFDGGSGAPTDVRTITRVVSQIRKFRPDIIHGAVYEGVTLAALAGTIGRVPHIVVEETGDPAIRSWRGDLLMAGLSRLADRAVGVSPAITDYLSGRLRLGEKVTLVMNGVDPPRIPSREELSEARASFGIPEDAFVVGTAGRIDNDHKRFTDLLTAVTELPDVYLMIVGSGQDLEMLGERAQELGIDDRVIRTGYQQDMGLMYHLMDVFALASRQESFGLVIAEAMFCGIPVVATRVGGIPYIVENGRTGFLVDPFEPAQMAQGLRDMRDDERRLEMGEASRKRAQAHFRSDRYVRDVETMYLELMGRA